MYNLKVIKTEKDYRAALRHLENIFDAHPDTKQGDEAELLMILIQYYEKMNDSIDAPDPVEAIKFRLEQLNLNRGDLVKYLGSESRVSEILNGKRSLTLNMIIGLHNGLHIPLESLIPAQSSSTSRIKYPHPAPQKRASLARESKTSYAKKKTT